LAAVVVLVMAYFLMAYRGVGSGFLRSKESSDRDPAAG
jgi:putative exporter of polyketide antibiotics